MQSPSSCKIGYILPQKLFDLSLPYVLHLVLNVVCISAALCEISLVRNQKLLASVNYKICPSGVKPLKLAFTVAESVNSFRRLRKVALLAKAINHSRLSKGICGETICGYFNSSAMCVLLDCGKQHFLEVTSEISSPHYPDNYGVNEHCFYYIHNPFKQLMTITFRTFALEYDSDCDYDYLMVSMIVSDCHFHYSAQ